MTVQLTSDLLVGVMQAANPVRARAATARLAGLAAAAPADTPALQPVSFASLFTAPQSGTAAGDLIVGVMKAADPQRLAAANARLGATAADGPRLAAATPADPYRKFEGFLLRTAFEDILPPADSCAFGTGFAGGVWRSMAAEQFANLFADRGGLGLADEIRQRDTASVGPTASSQWPYFEQPSLSPLA